MWLFVVIEVIYNPELFVAHRASHFYLSICANFMSADCTITDNTYSRGTLLKFHDTGYIHVMLPSGGFLSNKESGYCT